MKTIHIIGDSISVQYGPWLEQYISHACHYSRKTGEFADPDDPQGANGGDSSMVLDYLDQCLKAGLRWDCLIINCGLHDIKCYDGVRQIGPADYERNLTQIFDRASDLASQTIWVRTTPVIDDVHNARSSEFQRFNADVEEYNKIADWVAASRGANIIDLNGFCHALGGAETYADHVHFRREIQQLQAAFIAGQIMAMLEE